jgi:glutamate-5-semialdehyde dehydrogenase
MRALEPLDADRIEAEVGEIARAAHRAAHVLARAGGAVKNAALHAAARAIRGHCEAILAANGEDVAAATGLSPAMSDRLRLDEARVEAMAKGLEEVARLPDPVGRVLASWTRPNGLEIARIAVPIGVIGVIYESRPNVTADAGGLCLKSGNAAILRGGSESFHSSSAIMDALQEGLREAGLPAAAIQLIPTRERAAVGAMLRMDSEIDLIVPRGGRRLIERVKEESRIPVFAHLDGVCHVYVHGRANLEMAREVLFNAKMRRTGICGAAETLLIDRAIAEPGLARLLDPLIEAGCEVRGDEAARAVDGRLRPAREEDWSTEYLDAILSVRVVEGLDEAIDHVNDYGSHHTDSIITEDADAAERFLREVESGIVMHNCSTQFADGGEFGMGAEIGISTGKLHARGPVGAEQLTTYQYRVRGRGQVRP